MDRCSGAGAATAAGATSSVSILRAKLADSEPVAASLLGADIKGLAVRCCDAGVAVLAVGDGMSVGRCSCGCTWRRNALYCAAVLPWMLLRSSSSPCIFNLHFAFPACNKVQHRTSQHQRTIMYMLK